MKKRYLLLYTAFILSMAWGAPKLWSAAGDYLLSPGSTDITTLGTIATGTWEGTTVAVDQGGTGATTLTDGGILLGSGTASITSLGVATNGQIPIGDGSTDPTLGVIQGTTSGVSVTNKPGEIHVGLDDYISLSGVTTSTGYFLGDDDFIGIRGSEERIVFDSDGNDIEIMGADVGIGTTGPNVPLEVRGSTANSAIVRFHNLDARYLEISAESDGTYDDAITVFKKNSAVGQFAFRDSGGEYMRIDEIGNIGIGTMSPHPGYKLDIFGNVRAINVIYGNQFQSGHGSASAPGFTFSGEGDIGMFRSAVNEIAFSTAGNEAVRIDSNGNVGINDTSPDYKLEVLATTTQLALTHTDATDYAIFSVDGDGQLDITTVDGGGAGGHIALMPDGNVGVNTLTPGYRLQVGSSTSTSQIISVYDTTAMAIDNGGIIGFEGNYLTATGSPATFAGVGGKKETAASGNYAGYLGFYTATHGVGTLDERVRIDSTGDVGFGTTSPGAQLHTTKGRIVNTTRVTSGVTLDATHHHVFADTDGGAFTVGLPAGVDGTYYRFVNVGSSGNNLTINPTAGDTVRGAASHAVTDGTTIILVYETTEKWW